MIIIGGRRMSSKKKPLEKKILEILKEGAVYSEPRHGKNILDALKKKKVSVEEKKILQTLNSLLARGEIKVRIVGMRYNTEDFGGLVFKISLA